MTYLLGYGSILGLGLLPLAALARAFGDAASRPFLLPTEGALLLAFVIGLIVTAGVGRVLGVLEFGALRRYEDHRDRRTAFVQDMTVERRRAARRAATA